MSDFFGSIASFFINKWRVTLLLVITCVVAGVFGTLNNQRQAFPSIPANFIVVSAVYPGASSVLIEQDVTNSIEQVVKDLDTVVGYSSNSRDNFTSIVLESSEFTKEKLNKLASDAESAINGADIPQEVEVSTSTINAGGESMVLALVDSDKTVLEQIQNAEEIAIELEKVSSDIKGVTVEPSSDIRFEIELDKQKLQDNSVSYDDVSNAIQGATNALPGGNIDNLNISITPSINTIEELKELKVGGKKISELGTMEQKLAKDIELPVAGYLDGETPKFEQAVYLLVELAENGDAITASDKILGTPSKDNKDVLEGGALAELISENGEYSSMSYQVLYDSANDVKGQIGDLLKSGLIGLILVLVVLLFFINLRAAVVVAAFLPLAFLITLFVLYWIGFSINILTLFAMILALGVMIDNAIVIAEGMVFELEKGKSRKDAAIDAVKRFAPAVTAATVTTLIVFIPFANLGGIIGEFMKYIPFTIIIMMIVSYFLAIAITPLMGRIFLSNKIESERPTGISRFLILPYIVWGGQQLINGIARGYKATLKFLLSHWVIRLVTSIVSIVMIATGFWFASQVPGGEFPDVDSEFISINADYPSNFEDSERQLITNEVEEIIKQDIPEFVRYYNFGSSYNLEITESKDRERTADEIQDLLNSKLIEIEKRYDNIKISASKEATGPPGADSDIELTFNSPDLVNLEKLSAELTEFLKNDDRITRASNTFLDRQEQSLNVVLDQIKLDDKKLNSIAVSSIINQNNSESKVTTVKDNSDRDTDVYLSLGESSTELANTELIPTVELSDVATVTEQSKLSSISHDNGQRVVTVSADVNDADDISKIENEVNEWLGYEYTAGSFGRETKELASDSKLSEYGLNEDSLKVGGLSGSSDESSNKLILVAIIAVILVFVVLVNQFNSFRKPMLILFTVIFAFAGVFPTLYFLGETANFISGLGIVALIGIAINDAIVFVDTFVKRRQEENETLNQSLVETGYQRFKPILSTTLTTCLGILPLAIADPFWRGLGVSIVAGLVFSTIATLVFVPVWWGIRGERKTKKA